MSCGIVLRACYGVRGTEIAYGGQFHFCLPAIQRIAQLSLHYYFQVRGFALGFRVQESRFRILGLRSAFAACLEGSTTTKSSH